MYLTNLLQSYNTCSVNTITLELMYYCNMFRLRRVIFRLIT